MLMASGTTKLKGLQEGGMNYAFFINRARLTGAALRLALRGGDAGRVFDGDFLLLDGLEERIPCVS